MQPVCHKHKGVERRAQPRTDVEVFGRCLLASKLEIPCQTIDISPAGLGVAAKHSPSIGEPVIIYLDKLGRIEGTV
ncbi:MAG: PilZ domain-containing protein, partial [Rhizobiaceae bacterium]